MGNTSKNTDAAQKAYKKAKKQRRKLRRAEQERALMQQQKNSDQQNTSKKQINNKKWHRVGKEDGAKKAVDRPLQDGHDVGTINELLQQRSNAKEEKDYTVSDKITKTLVGLQIVYDDDKREWHTRAWKSLKPLM